MDRRRLLISFFAAGLLASALLALSGCATTGARMSGEKPQPIRVAAIVEWSKEGLPAATIITRLRDSETVYRLSARQMIRLHQEGVRNTVLDYMQATYVDAVRRDRRRMDVRTWNRYDDGYLYGGPWYGWDGPSFDFDEEGGDMGDEGD